MIVNVAVPFEALAASPLLRVTVQVRSAPAEFRFVQLTEETPVPAVAAVAVTPEGSWSLTVAEVPVVVPPLLPSPIVYVSVPPVRTVDAADFDMVMLDGVLTVVDALPQLVVEHDDPGVAGLLPPEASTEA